ncbi:SHOCT domain-containing protein [Hymenobacter properus]|uniref:SHOCT domain-containing protein n=1 Tax=Hymenobacter properus TaxID=2791026 RepID=A0A931BDE5_9BACT|nr:SHOCT domain-containing protein [Hymenobacter properus]MBF9141774.1 SHOCT domain-containing protein [Hymenobacter properus]MBR7720582.1 SHOCT domain-containing protein [Microvirga sp. SRT04]
MDNPNSSPLDTLRQLKEMLDSGALTPTEFEALKQRLVFHDGATPAAPAASASSDAAPEAPVVLPANPAVETPSPMFEDVTQAEPPLAPLPPSFTASAAEAAAAEEEPAFIPPAVRRALEADTTAAPAASLPPPAAPSPGLAAADAGYVADEFPAGSAPATRSPLALILSIGGLLALLGLVLYLSLNRQPSEHISSTSQTAADTLAAPIETGPQAEQVAPVTAAPETIRVAPTNPAPPVPSPADMARKAAAVRDSAAAAAPVAADSAASQ